MLRAEAAINAESAPRPGFVPNTNIDPLTGQVTPVRVPPGAAGPETVPYAPTTPEVVPTTEPPGPQSVGAGASRQGTPAADIGLTPEQSAAAGSTADKQWLYQTAVPGEADNTVYLKGINPTMAQREQTVNAARDSKLLRRISPDAEQAEREVLAEHTNIRKGEFQDIAGSDVTHEAEMKAASDQIETQLQAAYAHGGTVDLQPVIDAANAELTGSAGKLPPVKAAMKAIIDAAEKSDGSGLETDPRQANAVRRAIIYMQSREGKLENPGYGHPDTLAALTRVKDVLTKQVEPAAPGFTEANANYARARQATDAREALQKYEPRLYDGLGNMRYNAFHNMMKEIIAARDPNAPLGPWKSLTEEQMNRLKSVHDDLKRAASAEDLARANGSDTTQTLFDLAKRAARHATGTGAGAVVGFGVSHILGPEAGMAAGMFTKDAVTHMFEKGAVDRATAEHNKLLHPDPTKYPTRANPLTNPDAYLTEEKPKQGSRSGHHHQRKYVQIPSVGGVRLRRWWRWWLLACRTRWWPRRRWFRGCPPCLPRRVLSGPLGLLGGHGGVWFHHDHHLDRRQRQQPRPRQPVLLAKRLGLKRRRGPLTGVLASQHSQDARQALSLGGGHHSAPTFEATRISSQTTGAPTA